MQASLLTILQSQLSQSTLYVTGGFNVHVCEFVYVFILNFAIAPAAISLSPHSLSINTYKCK
ncbi:hypothetical protein H6G03_26505 [Planktothrix sp. FACHB-1375]|uniref:Uncharacterized protein n=1 Tax=Aerosakkonema funiforme FACHB-1375 TaxID=2949571 RepID=A0A926VIR0_9CYAN|nr:hypothetical protein [Aerosakkonema funiforme FACHB-1375]